MPKILPLLILAAPLWSQTISLQPEVITRCSAAGTGSARVSWTSPGPGMVQVRIGSPGGTAMTGLEPATGSEPAGDWIANGMVFVLTDASGRELARTTAQVLCNPSYLPLEVGNQWMYRYNARFVTSDYEIWRVVRSEMVNDRLWFVVEQTLAHIQQANPVGLRMRTDEQGRIFRLNARTNAEELLLDPSLPANPAAILRTTGQLTSYRSPLGEFRDGVSYQFSDSLSFESGTYVRGLGLTGLTRSLRTGSSGGFTDGLELIYARLGGTVLPGTRATGLELSAESTDLNVTGHEVTNCAIPCYFVACLVGGADLPDTYKPCFQARVRLPGSSGPVELRLLDSSDRVVFRATQLVPASGEQPEGLLYRQIPLYTAPNQPVPPGIYRLRAGVAGSDGTETASAVLTVRVR